MISLTSVIDLFRDFPQGKSMIFGARTHFRAFLDADPNARIPMQTALILEQAAQ